MPPGGLPDAETRRKTALRKGLGLGCLSMLVAGLLFACMGVKLGFDHFSVAELMFHRSLSGVAVIVMIIRFQGLSLGSRHWKIHLSRGVIGFAGAMLLLRPTFTAKQTMAGLLRLASGSSAASPT